MSIVDRFKPKKSETVLELRAVAEANFREHYRSKARNNNVHIADEVENFVTETFLHGFDYAVEVIRDLLKRQAGKKRKEKSNRERKEF